MNSVVPGWMMGPPVELYLSMTSEATGRTEEEVRRDIVGNIALGDIPPQEECANAVVFFASDLSSWITGQSLDVNGGEVLR